MKGFDKLIDNITWIIVRALYSHENPIVSKMSANDMKARDDLALIKYHSDAFFSAKVKTIVIEISSEICKFKGKSGVLPMSTKPLLEGCIPNKHNFEMLDYCDSHGLNRSAATFIDSDGNLQLKSDCHKFKLTQSEKVRGELSFKMLTDKNIYDNPAKLGEIKKQINNLG